MTDAVRARAWCRVDLGGGTLDIWPIGLLHPGARTVNTAVSIAAVVKLRSRAEGYTLVQGSETHTGRTAAELRAQAGAALFGQIAEYLALPPVEIEVASGSPRGGGLGASSALAVAAIAAGEAFLGQTSSSAEVLAASVRDLEASLMELPTGTQDQLAAIHGGVLEVLHRPGGTRVRRLEVDLEAFGASLVVAYSGQSHFSAGNNWQVVRRRLDGDSQVTDAFAGIADVAARMPEALEAGDFRLVGSLMSQEWSFRRELAPEVSTPVVEALLATSRAAGGWGGKVCGAGGGGCLAVLCPPEARDAVATALTTEGATVLEATPAAEPLEVVIEQGAD